MSPSAKVKLEKEELKGLDVYDFDRSALDKELDLKAAVAGGKTAQALAPRHPLAPQQSQVRVARGSCLRRGMRHAK